MMLPPRAYVFLSLNAVRILSIIALLLIFASNIVTMVGDIKAVRAGSTSLTYTDASGETETYDCDYFDNSTVPNQPAGAFWAVVNRLFILSTTILMLLSEIGWPDQFFKLYFPVLGPEFGVGILGGMQWVTAASILSHHVDDFPLVSGFFLFVIGCFNILLGLIYRSSVKEKRSIMSWRQAKANELLPAPIQAQGKNIRVLQTSVSSIFEKGGSIIREDNTGGASTHSTTGPIRVAFGAGYGFARQGEKKAAHEGFTCAKPVESLPRYHPRPPSGNSRNSEAESEPEAQEVPGNYRPTRI